MKFIRNSIRVKTILGVALIEAVLLISLVFMMLGYIRDSNSEALETRAETTARLFATTAKDAVLGFDLATLYAFVNEVMTNPGLEYARVINAEGQLLASSGGSEDLQPITDLTIDDVNDGVFDVRAPIRESGQTYGWVEVGFSTDPIQLIVDRAKRWSFTIVILEMVLVALFSFMLGRFLTHKLSALRDAAQAIGEGDLSRRVEVPGEDEIDVVGKAFNQMTRAVESSHLQMNQLTDELRELNETLEDKVRLRTYELQKLNADLESAIVQIQSAQTQLLESEKRATIGVLTAGVAHEINNPLGFVISNIATLKEYQDSIAKLTSRLLEAVRGEAPLDSTQLDALLRELDYEFINEDLGELFSDTQKGLDRVKVIVEKMTALQHSQSVSASIVSPKSAITDALARLGESDLPKCAVSIPEAIPPKISGSHDALVEALYTVLKNACQSVKESGSVSIDFKLDDEHLLLAVSDTGAGVPSEHREKIFDPFFTTRPVGDGTGLGLYRARMLLETVNAQLYLDEEYSTGARFILRLPLAKVDEGADSQ